TLGGLAPARRDPPGYNRRHEDHQATRANYSLCRRQGSLSRLAEPAPVEVARPLDDRMTHGGGTDMGGDSETQIVTLAMTGASGASYGLRLVECLIAAGWRVYLMVSKPAHIVISSETELAVP